MRRLGITMAVVLIGLLTMLVMRLLPSRSSIHGGESSNVAAEKGDTPSKIQRELPADTRSIQTRAVTPPVSAPKPSVDLSRFPTTLPDTQEVNDAIEEQLDGSVDARAVYEYLLPFYRELNRCLNGQIVHGTVYYWLVWRIDDNGGRVDDFFLNDRFAPTITEDELALFKGCVQSYTSSHRVPGLQVSDHWGMQTDFPLENEWVVRLARGELAAARFQ